MSLATSSLCIFTFACIIVELSCLTARAHSKHDGNNGASLAHCSMRLFKETITLIRDTPFGVEQVG